MNKWSFLRVYMSPFKRPRILFHIGKVSVGTPIFLPRVWVSATPERAHKAVQDYIKREESYNTMNPNYARKIRPYEDVYAEKMRYSYAVPKRVGFDFVGLGWKTKWSGTDYRHEWNPVWSFVFFGLQIAVIFRPEHETQYWEAWLYYTNNTDKSKSVQERVKQCREGFPITYTSYRKGEEKETVDYYTKVLKRKYI